jgi:hypothetical protein
LACSPVSVDRVMPISALGRMVSVCLNGSEMEGCGVIELQKIGHLSIVLREF